MKSIFGEAIVLFGLPILKVIGYYLMVYGLYQLITKYW